MLLKELVGRRVKVVVWEHLGLMTNTPSKVLCLMLTYCFFKR
jgi:hypothetical protein